MTGPPALLVIDDETEFLTTYRRLFERQGYRVVAADSCAAALSVDLIRLPAVRWYRLFDRVS